MNLKIAAASLLAVTCWALAAPKVVNLKKFLDTKVWRLDITYSAKDSFEDRDFVLQLEMKAQARYYLERINREEAWGQWQALQVQSINHTWKAFRQSKTSGRRTEYSARLDGQMVAPLADFHVGGFTPGYMLTVGGGFPGEMRDGNSLTDHPLVLGTTLKDMPGLSGTLSGPLPESGTQIHASRVIPYDVPPFCADSPRQTRMSIEVVIQPDARLAPLQ